MRRANAKEARASARIPVWDWPVRLLHWSLAALVGVDLVRDDGDYEHRMIGYTSRQRATSQGRLVITMVVDPSGDHLDRDTQRVSAGAGGWRYD